MFQNQLCQAAAATAAVDCRPRQELIARRARGRARRRTLLGNTIKTCSLVREAQTPYVSHVYGG